VFPERLVQEQPFATKLFRAAIQSNKLAQAYMFTQAQAIVQYNFALQLAKILNCSNPLNNTPCNECTNCKWINSNTHPAVITVSPVDFIPQKGEVEDVEVSRSKNEIKVAQAALLQKELMSSSKYHRIVIFMGAKEEKLPAEIVDKLWLNYRDKVSPPQNQDGRELWVPTHLNYQTFPARTANILLKTIEEPFGNILFIFITKDTDDMLSTIVSRCQVIPILRVRELEIEPAEYIQEIASYLPPENELEALQTAKKLLDYAKTEGIATENLVEYIEILYHRNLLNKVEQEKFSENTFERIKTIENTKNMLKNYVNPQAALISLMNALIPH
jgi:DNA polymerase III delta prime subunit